MAKPVRVLHVSKTYYPDTVGGVEQVIRQLSAATGKIGIENQVFTLSRHADEIPVVVKDSVTVTRAPVHVDIASTPMSARAFALFRQCVASADVVQYHYPWPFGDVLHLVAGRAKPAIVTYHSDVVRQRLLMPLYNPLLRAFLGRVQAIVPTSSNYLHSSKLLQDYRDKAVVIPLGLDESAYPPPHQTTLDKWKGAVGEKFFLFVGVLRYYKGLHILLDACARSRSRVVIVGEGPEAQRLRKQASDLGLNNVLFVGALSEEDKIALLSLCRAVVFPSQLRSEAFGMTLLEGAIFGKALISAEIGTGSSYINIDGITGLVVPPSDASALAAAMERLWNDDGLAQAMGRAARERFDRLFTASKMAKAYGELYQRILDEAY